MTNIVSKEQEDLLEIVRLSAESTQNLVAAVQATSNVVAEIQVGQQEDREILKSVMEEVNDLKYRAPIKGYQKVMLSKAVGRYVYKILGDKKNQSRINRAYKMAYRALRPYGYTTMDSTEIGRFDEIMEATKHALTFTFDDILQREKEDMEAELRNKGN